MGVRLERDGGVAVITLDRPEVLNAMDPDMYAEITELFREIDADAGVRVGIVTGAGERAFSAGADLKLMHGVDAQPDGWGPWRPTRWDFGAVPAKPMIAAIDGYALAGGLELALVCDLRIATPRSQFGCPEVRWNLLHGFGGLRLPGVVGLSNAMMLLLTGEFIDAQEALRIGLVNRIVSSQELMPTALRLAGRVAENAPEAVLMSKELALHGADGTLEQGMRLYRAYFGLLERTLDQHEGTRAFAEKRQPQFEGD
jgi:enoyl-CoA hydratase/carnithine racemase